MKNFKFALPVFVRWRTLELLHFAGDCYQADFIGRAASTVFIFELGVAINRASEMEP
jgi:hypothetical protein